jgi:hypothetical protein
MITNFEVFNEGRLLNIPRIVYSDDENISRYEKEIKNYFMEKYSEMITNTEKPIFSLRKQLSATAIERLIKFAKTHNDKKLATLVNDYLDFIDIIKMRIDTKKNTIYETFKTI